MLSDLWIRMRALLRRKSVEGELDDELRFHFEAQVAKYVAAGVPRGEATRRARLEFGGLDQVKEECRDARGVHLLESLAQDIRYGLRMLRKSPGFTLVAVLTLALGIGANTAIFSIVHAVLLNQLPYPDAKRLAIIESGFSNEVRAPASKYEVAALRQRSTLFEHIDGIWVTNSLVPGEGEPEQVKLGVVTDDFLTLLCARPAVGRLFTPEDASNSSTMVISYGLWQRRFGGDPNIIGRTLRSGEDAFTIIGVVPKDFRLIFPDDANVPPNVDIFIPIKVDLSEPTGPEFLHTIGLLRPGVNFAQAQSEADRMAEDIRHVSPHFAAEKFSLHVAPLHQDDVREVRRTLALLFAGVALVVLIACANIANLFLTRVNSRVREMTIRTALGAGRSRTIRQLLTECIVLSLFGGMAALAVGWLALKGLISLGPQSLLRLATIELDSTALSYTLGISVFCGLLAGIVPALVASRVDLIAALKNGARGTPMARHFSPAVLVTAEVALSFGLLIGTGLLVRTFISVLRVNPGFRPENVLTFTTSGRDYNFVHNFQQRLAAIPGVESASLISHLPFDDAQGNWYDSYYPEGTPPAQQTTNFADCRSVLPGFFRTIGATLIEGRDFTDLDDVAHQHVAIIDDNLARQAWPNQDALGKRLSVSDSPKGFYQFERDWVVVVGVVKHVQDHSLTVTLRPQIYMPFPLAPRPVSYVVRSSTPISILKAQIREQLAKLDKGMPLARVVSLSDLVDRARAQSRFVALLTGVLAGLALTLACIGIAAVTSYSVVQRTNEIGIRMTLGAAPREVLQLLLEQNIRPVLAGIGLGFAVSLAMTPLLATFLFGVKPTDPLTFASVAVLLALAALAACYTPARRATRVDPMVALRHE